MPTGGMTNAFGGPLRSQIGIYQNNGAFCCKFRGVLHTCHSCNNRHASMCRKRGSLVLLEVWDHFGVHPMKKATGLSR